MSGGGLRSRRGFLAVFLILTLLVAGGGGYYASGAPDGLERVAEQTGFADSAEDSATSESPLADYETAGVENERVGTGLAGLVGALVVLLLAGGLAYGLRRRGEPGPEPSTEPSTEPGSEPSADPGPDSGSNPDPGSGTSPAETRAGPAGRG